MPRTVTADERQELTNRLSRDGFAVLPDYLAENEITALRDEIAVLHAAPVFGTTDFAGHRTKRVFNLVAKTRAFDALMLDKTILSLIEALLGPRIQLSIASTIEIHPGEPAQPLHQDDFIYHQPSPHAPLVCNSIWALDPFTEANGATRLIPGSHRWPDTEIPDAPTIAGEMPAGSVLLPNGALWHGGGANRSDAPQLGLSINWTCAWLRQQENQYLSVPPETVRQIPAELQKLIGYSASEFLGYVDGVHPREWLQDSN